MCCLICAQPPAGQKFSTYPQTFPQFSTVRDSRIVESGGEVQNILKNMLYNTSMSNYEDVRLTTVPKMGRPKKFQSVEELEEMITDYFESCFIPKTFEKKVVDLDDDKIEVVSYVTTPVVNKKGDEVLFQIRPFTVTGLALALDTTRDVLLDYEKNPENADFSNTIKRAKQIIHNYAEEFLFNGKNVTGAIFNLKNNWGYVDRTETDVTTKGRAIAPEAAAAKAADILGPSKAAEVTENDDEN